MFPCGGLGSGDGLLGKSNSGGGGGVAPSQRVDVDVVDDADVNADDVPPKKDRKLPSLSSLREDREEEDHELRMAAAAGRRT